MPPSPSATRARAGLFLALTVVTALFSVFAVSRYLGSVGAKQSTLAVQETVKVVVAARNLYVGQAVQEMDVQVREISKDAVPEYGVFMTVEEVRGRTPRERILANELLREERLARPDAGIGLNAIVTPGRRAMTIGVTTENAVAGLLQPNNYVDIIVTIRPDNDEDRKWIAETILQGIKVLAVGSDLDERAESAAAADPKSKDGKAKKVASSNPNSNAKLRPSITLEVTPEEAEKLALAVNRGDISVVLRSDIDIVVVPDEGRMDINNLVGRPVAVAPTGNTAPPVVRSEPEAEPAQPGTVVITGSSAIEYDAAGNPVNNKRKK